LTKNLPYYSTGAQKTTDYQRARFDFALSVAGVSDIVLKESNLNMVDKGDMYSSCKPLIAVVGASQASAAVLRIAENLGRSIAAGGAVLICGGLGGVMEAASRGAAKAGGEVVAILPGADKMTANPYVTIPISTGMGHARNVIIAHTADVLIATEGEYGTLSEVAIALKLGKKVVVLPGGPGLKGTTPVKTAEEAVALAFEDLQI
jgi:uncharacterized protein (TIGR00725 family)